MLLGMGGVDLFSTELASLQAHSMQLEQQRVHALQQAMLASIDTGGVPSSMPLAVGNPSVLSSSAMLLTSGAAAAVPLSPPSRAAAVPPIQEAASSAVMPGSQWRVQQPQPQQPQPFQFDQQSRQQLLQQQLLQEQLRQQQLLPQQRCEHQVSDELLERQDASRTMRIFRKRKPESRSSTPPMRSPDPTEGLSVGDLEAPTDDISSARAVAREKNRLAQQKFRHRQRSTIAQQQSRVRELESQLRGFKQEVQVLREENNRLRTRLEAVSAAQVNVAAGAHSEAPHTTTLAAALPM